MNLPTINFGAVKHRRFRPAQNTFGYGVFTLSIPMRARKADNTLLSKHGLRDNHFGLFAFFDQDHGVGNRDSLAWIEQVLQENHIHSVDGEIWLQTFPRVLGYVFNPVSFWICARADGQVQDRRGEQERARHPAPSRRHHPHPRGASSDPLLDGLRQRRRY